MSVAFRADGGRRRGRVRGADGGAAVDRQTGRGGVEVAGAVGAVVDEPGVGHAGAALRPLHEVDPIAGAKELEGYSQAAKK